MANVCDHHHHIFTHWRSITFSHIHVWLFISPDDCTEEGILSPLLFNVFIYDDLCCIINSSKVGCHLNKVCFNHLKYADMLRILQKVIKWFPVQNRNYVVVLGIVMALSKTDIMYVHYVLKQNRHVCVLGIVMTLSKTDMYVY